MRKKSLAIALVLTALLSAHVFAEDDRPIRLWANGSYRFSDVDLYINNNRTMVPLRAVSDALGYDVTWMPKSRTVWLQSKVKPDDRYQIAIGARQIKGTKDKKPVTYPTDVAAEIKNGRTFLPLRAVSTALGYPVDWDAVAKTAVVGEGYKSPNLQSFSPKTLSLSLNKKPLGKVEALAKRGDIFVEYNALAKALAMTATFVEDNYGGGKEDISITLIEPGGWWINYDDRYTTSADGLNFGRYDYLNHIMENDKIYVSLKHFVDAKHWDMTLSGDEIQLAMNKTEDIYPLKLFKYTKDFQAFFFVPTNYFHIRFNGTRYVLTQLDPLARPVKDLDFAEYREKMPYHIPDRNMAKQDDLFHLRLAGNNHFYLLRDEAVVLGGISD